MTQPRSDLDSDEQSARDLYTCAGLAGLLGAVGTSLAGSVAYSVVADFTAALQSNYAIEEVIAHSTPNLLIVGAMSGPPILASLFFADAARNYARDLRVQNRSTHCHGDAVE